MATINIIFDRTSTIDPVTRGLDIALRYLHINIDVPLWSQYISFRYNNFNISKFPIQVLWCCKLDNIFSFDFA